MVKEILFQSLNCFGSEIFQILTIFLKSKYSGLSHIDDLVTETQSVQIYSLYNCHCGCHLFTGFVKLFLESPRQVCYLVAVACHLP